MSKVGRNDPCPCGSGKKFKKCHGASNVVELNPIIYNKDFERLQVELMEFARTNYERELTEVIFKRPFADFKGDKEYLDLYVANAKPWAVMHAPIENDKTIFDIYFEDKEWRINNERVKHSFAEWSKTIPAVYQLISDNEEFMTLKNIRTGENFEVYNSWEEPFKDGHIIVGQLIPYLNRYAFFSAVLAFSNADAKVFEFLKSQSSEELVTAYPKFLQALLTAEPSASPEEAVETSFTWENPLHEEVALLLQEKAKGSIDRLQEIWKLYTDKENPSFRKAGGFASAVEYVYYNSILEDASQSQQMIAEEYGVSTTTLSKNAKKITSVLQTEIETMRKN